MRRGHRPLLCPLSAAAGREVRENMFKEVADLYHDLDDGMRPISILFPCESTACSLLRPREAALHARCRSLHCLRQCCTAEWLACVSRCASSDASPRQGRQRLHAFKHG